MAAPSPTPCSCTACRLTGAWRSAADVIDGPRSVSSCKVTTVSPARGVHWSSCSGAPREREAQRQQRVIARLIDEQAVTNQPQLVELLGAEGSPDPGHRVS